MLGTKNLFHGRSVQVTLLPRVLRRHVNDFRQSEIKFGLNRNVDPHIAIVKKIERKV